MTLGLYYCLWESMIAFISSMSFDFIFSAESSLFWSIDGQWESLGEIYYFEEIEGKSSWMSSIIVSFSFYQPIIVLMTTGAGFFSADHSTDLDSDEFEFLRTGNLTFSFDFSLWKVSLCQSFFTDPVNVNGSSYFDFGSLSVK